MLSYNAGSSSYSVVEHHIIMETYRMGSECGYEDIIRVTCYDKSTISRAAASLERKDIVESFPQRSDLWGGLSTPVDKPPQRSNSRGLIREV